MTMNVLAVIIVVSLRVPGRRRLPLYLRDPVVQAALLVGIDAGEPDLGDPVAGNSDRGYGERLFALEIGPHSHRLVVVEVDPALGPVLLLIHHMWLPRPGVCGGVIAASGGQGRHNRGGQKDFEECLAHDLSIANVGRHSSPGTARGSLPRKGRG